MGKMLSAKLRWSRDGVYQHWCPACSCRHEFYVRPVTNASGAGWHWDGNVDSPTLPASMIGSV